MGSFGGPVLIVEDEPSIRELMRDLLEQEGFEVAVATDGQEAVRLAKARRPALVLLDMGLPRIDGASVAAQIRDAYGDAVPFVVVTASRRIEEAAAQTRARAYITKPFDVKDLVRVVRLALEPAPGPSTSEGTATSNAS